MSELTRAELEALAEVDALADYIAKRIELATVTRLPAALIEAMAQTGRQQWLNLYAPEGSDRVCLKVARVGDLLELEWELNGNRVATQRFGPRA